MDNFELPQVDFNDLAAQGEVISELENLTYIYLFFFYYLVYDSNWKPDKTFKSSKYKKYFSIGNDTKLYANEAALAYVELHVVKKSVDSKEEENNSSNFTYFGNGYIKYNGYAYIVEDLVKLFNLIYSKFRKEILNKENKKLYLENEEVSSVLVNDIIYYINDLINDKKINIKFKK